MPEQFMVKQETLNLAEALQRAAHWCEKGEFGQAETLYRQVLAIRPDQFDALHILGAIKLKQQSYEEAVRLLTAAVGANSNSSEAHSNLGLALMQLGRYKKAVVCCDLALAIDPSLVEALNNRGRALGKLGRYEEAVESYKRALAIKPDHADAWNNRGIALEGLERRQEAIASYDRALSIRSGFIAALFNRANAFEHLEQNDEALASYDGALAVNPNLAEVLNNRGLVLNKIGRHEEAVDSYRRALAVRFNYAEARFNRGIALERLRQFAEAVASYDSALAIKPKFAEALNNRGDALAQLGLLREALVSYDKAVALAPHYAEPLYGRGLVLERVDRYADAISSYTKVLSISRDHPYAFGQLADCQLMICNWTAARKLKRELKVRQAEEKSIIMPLTLLCYGGESSQLLVSARRYLADAIKISPRPVWDGKVRRGGKVRIAYLFANPCCHPTASLIAELCEHHDRTRFEVVGASSGAYDGDDDVGSHVTRSFDQFYDVRFKSDQDVATLLNQLDVDIAVDLQGHTKQSRPGILARRPAPIQVSFGYPASMGANFIDYIIADKIALPFDEQSFYSENIVHVPDSCRCANSKGRGLTNVLTRSEAGLPDDAIVFCCFNNSCKITPRMFDIWMRLLRAIDRSVLWLSQFNDLAVENLLREAKAKSVDPARLVFATRTSPENHLARHYLADLFLDTLPYNGRMAVSDALSCGLPVLTCKGNTFASRTGASLLHAAGVPELVANNLEEYRTHALQLGRIRPRLKDLRRKLEKNRAKYPLFDSDRYRRHVEAAYVKMWELWQRGERPQSFSVEPM